MLKGQRGIGSGVYIYAEVEKDRYIDRQTDRQTHRHTDRQKGNKNC